LSLSKDHSRGACVPLGHGPVLVIEGGRLATVCGWCIAGLRYGDGSVSRNSPRLLHAFRWPRVWTRVSLSSTGLRHQPLRDRSSCLKARRPGDEPHD
jgi:hypothetical protein